MIRETKYKGYSCDPLGNFYNKKGKKVKVQKNNTFAFYSNGKRVTRSVLKTLWETFNGEVPKGYIVVRKNDKSNSLHNLKIIKFSEVQTVFKARYKQVSLYENGEAVTTFRSVNECARKMFMHRATVQKICDGVHKKKHYIDLRWEY